MFDPDTRLNDRFNSNEVMINERLAKRFEAVAVELRQFVEEQNAVVRE